MPGRGLQRAVSVRFNGRNKLLPRQADAVRQTRSGRCGYGGEGRGATGARRRFLTPAALCLDVGGRCGRTDTCKNASASRLAPVCFAACPVKHDKSPRSTAPDTEQSFQKVRDVSLLLILTSRW